MTEARRHHFVSQFYLRSFLRSGTPPLLYVIDEPRRADFATSTHNVAQQRDFHRIEVAGVAPNTVENALAKFEGEVASSLSVILDRRAVGHDDHGQALLYYMALTLVKNRAMRSNIDEFTERIMTAIARHDAADPVAFRNKVERMIEEGAMEPGTDAKSSARTSSRTTTRSRSRVRVIWSLSAERHVRFSRTLAASP